MTPKLTNALKSIAGLATLGDFFRDVDLRLTALEKIKDVSVDVTALRQSTHDRLNIFDSEWGKRLTELEEALENVLESSPLTALTERMNQMEVMLLEYASDKEVEEKAAAVPAKARKISVFGCLPRQYEALKVKLPHLDITRLPKSTGNVAGEYVFICAAMTKKSDFDAFHRNHKDKVINMDGALSTWVKTINETMHK